MKTRLLLPAITVITFALAGVGSQPLMAAPPMMTGGTPGGMQNMDQRFAHMNQIMGQAERAHGQERLRLMQAHMALMLTQMRTMQAMMGSGMMAGGMMGGSPAQGRSDALSAMQARMDLMQQMMAQMLNQQRLMMPATGQAPSDRKH